MRKLLNMLELGSLTCTIRGRRGAEEFTAHERGLNDDGWLGRFLQPGNTRIDEVDEAHDIEVK
jgi:hypothetical protein